MYDDFRRGSGVFGAFLFGGLVGAVLGVLFAPRPGKETRELLAQKGQEYLEEGQRLYDEGRERLVEMVKAASGRVVQEAVRKQAPPAPENTLHAFLGDLLKTDSWLWSHVVSLEVVEQRPTVVEVRVGRCLWAQTFHEAGAADIGYAMVCHPDFFAGPAFNPRIRMTRTQTLMQGDDHCNHRWVVET